MRYVMHMDGLVQDCSNSIVNTLELLQSCTKPSIYGNKQQTLELGSQGVTMPEIWL